MRCILALVLAGSACAGPRPAAAQWSAWVEAGVGAGVAGEGGGMSYRTSIGAQGGAWGAIARAMGQSGAEGVHEPGFGGVIVGALFGPPTELFEEISVLAMRRLGAGAPVLFGAGLGVLTGRAIDPTDGVGLVDVGPTWGVPLELTYRGGDGGGVGGSVVLSAHLNADAPTFALGVALSLGFRGGGSSSPAGVPQ